MNKKMDVISCHQRREGEVFPGSYLFSQRTRSCRLMYHSYPPVLPLSFTSSDSGIAVASSVIYVQADGCYTWSAFLIPEDLGWQSRHKYVSRATRRRRINLGRVRFLILSCLWAFGRRAVVGVRQYFRWGNECEREKM